MNCFDFGILLPKLFRPTVRKNSSCDRKENLKFEAEGQEFAKILRSLGQFIQTGKGQKKFWNITEFFLTCSWRFLISNNLKQFEFQFEKNIGI